MNASRPVWPGRALALCFALAAAVFPGFGTIDLAVPVAAPSPAFAQGVMLEGGWGLVLSLLVAVPFLVVFLDPAAWAVALGQVAVVGAVIGVAGVLAGRPGFLVVTAALGLGAGLLAAMLRGRTGPGAPRTRRARAGASRTWHLALASVPFAGAGAALVLGAAPTAAWLGVVGAVAALAVVLSRLPADPSPRRWRPLVLGSVGALPWTWYAADMIEAAVEGREPVDVTMGLDHWPMQAALGLALVALAAWGHPVPAATGGIAAVAFGVLAVAHPGHPASPGPVWGGAALVWGLAVLPVRVALTGPAQAPRVAPESRKISGQ
ncbi:hypothetical protein [Nonomuraea pusilla]|uniref:Uncharacterized protein n=1 Tax=Nonomuraea pusilla TaxID=46177 RepID=A0A1H7ZUW2_9ACTN|nr:hypothetical protein [Nonomuraea pusilla]SEM62220.1 hypothetical protein SAMN05660976_05636 [Nonomuraea pusilla]